MSLPQRAEVSYQRTTRARQVKINFLCFDMGGIKTLFSVGAGCISGLWKLPSQSCLKTCQKQVFYLGQAAPWSYGKMGPFKFENTNVSM